MDEGCGSTGTPCPDPEKIGKRKTWSGAPEGRGEVMEVVWVYSPKIAEDLVKNLYLRAKREKKPMTVIVDEILRMNL